MGKVESLEQAAREWCTKNISNYEMLNVWTDTDVHCVMAQFAERKSAERERQVWAEAAKIADRYDGNTLYAGGVCQIMAKEFRARGEQVK